MAGSSEAVTCPGTKSPFVKRSTASESASRGLSSVCPASVMPARAALMRISSDADTIRNKYMIQLRGTQCLQSVTVRRLAGSNSSTPQPKATGKYSQQVRIGLESCHRVALPASTVGSGVYSIFPKQRHRPEIKLGPGSNERTPGRVVDSVVQAVVKDD